MRGERDGGTLDGNGFDFECTPTAVRVYTTRRRGGGKRPPKGEGKAILRRYPHEALVFDTETTTHPSQRLLFGVWRFYSDAPDKEPGNNCVEEGIFYPDNLEDWDPDGYANLIEFARNTEWSAASGYSRMDTERQLLAWPLSRWMDERLHRYAYKHRNPCYLIGFNLPFDLGRVSADWGDARKYFNGGWSLKLWPEVDPDGTVRNPRDYPRLKMKSIDPRRTIYEWESLGKDPEEDRGTAAHLVDLHTLAFALTDENYTLERACKAFGDDWDKEPPERYGVIDPEILQYAREDVEHTAILYRNCLRELAKHPGVGLQADQLFSPATVGVRYLEAMGVTPPLKKFRRSLSNKLLGWTMCTFYGGRAEARIVRTPMPVAYVDFTSMYPSVNALLDTWRLLVAAAVEVHDVTEDVRALLAAPDLLDRCFDPALWREAIGVTLVEIEDPDGIRLPIRALYDPDNPDYGIGVNPLRYQSRLWYMLPDVIAGVILSRTGVTVRRALRIVASDERQPDLSAVQLRGGEAIDPATTDPFVRMIEQRQRIRGDESLPKEERKRLDLFLKITANATAYGVLARFDRRELASEKNVTVYGPGGKPVRAKTATPEDPGPFCFPPVAASITAAARLMLALLERTVADAGGQYVFTDTDSMSIVATPEGGNIDCDVPDGTGTVHALSWEQVRAVLDQFAPLNPYDQDLVPSVWKVDLDSMTTPLHCYAISAKRYVLYRLAPDGTPMIEHVGDASEESDEESLIEEKDALPKWSEHGLGLYLDPRDPDHPQRDRHGKVRWTREAWEWILAQVYDTSVEAPEWAPTWAVSRFTVSSPAIAKWFEGFNASRPRTEHVRPGSFGLLAHSDPALGAGALPMAPYDRDPRRWLKLPWYDRRTGAPIRLTSADPTEDPARAAEQLLQGVCRVRTLGDVVSRYRLRPEAKSLAPDGARTKANTAGLLRPRPIESAPALTALVGKEGNKLDQRLTGEVTDPNEYRNTYAMAADPWKALVVPVLKEIGEQKVAEAVGVSERAARAWINGESEPHAGHRVGAIDLAVKFARQRLGFMSLEVVNDAMCWLHAYVKNLFANE